MITRAFHDWCADQCERILRTGGGALEQQVAHSGKRVPDDEQAAWLKLHAEGVSGNKIAKDRGWAQTTVSRYLRQFKQQAKAQTP